MRRYTTPALTLRIHGIRLSQSDRIWVSIRQKRKYDYVGPDIEISNATMTTTTDTTTVSFRLTQQQTASLEEGDAMIQVNWMTSSGERGATKRTPFKVTGNFIEEVLSYA